jgi:hypothetical protein
MKRRRFLQGIATAPALPAVLTQQPAVPVTPPPRPTEEVPKLEFAVHDDAGEMTPRFFNAQQFAALRRLSDILMPAIKDAPGALAAHAPEFLDFLIGASPTDRRQLYTSGLDLLNAQAAKQFHKPFSEVDLSQANALLAPLRQAWTYEPPADPLAHFLRAAKHDVRTATVNSREWSSANSAGSRRAGGMGQYWYPIE